MNKISESYYQFAKERMAVIDSISTDDLFEMGLEEATEISDEYDELEQDVKQYEAEESHLDWLYSI